MIRRRVLRSFRESERGATFVEFALIAPFLVFATLGGIEFARAVSSYQTANESMRVAVRYLARIPASTTKSWAVSNAKNLASYGSITVPTPAPTPIVPIANVNNPTASGTPTVVTMTADVPYTSGLLSGFGFSGITFHISHQERVIGE